jgi:hypothetical protein
MGALHKDIAKLHQKHGVKKSVIKGFKMLGMGIINGCGKINSILDNDDGTPYDASNSGVELYTPEQEASYKSYMSKYKSGRGVSKQAKWDSMPRYDPNNPVYTTMPQGTVSAPIKIKGGGANGKMLKNAAANATAGLISSGAARAIHEMDTRGKKGAGFKKGSQEAKDHMARIRAMRKTN